MNLRGKKGLCVSMLLVLPLLQVTATGAEGGQRKLGLELDEYLTLNDRAFETEDLASADGTSSAQPIQIATLIDQAAQGVYEKASAQQTTGSSSPGKMKRTGSWMKKHWWVPTLIGVAIGVVILEPFDSNDDDRREAQMAQ